MQRNTLKSNLLKIWSVPRRRQCRRPIYDLSAKKSKNFEKSLDYSIANTVPFLHKLSGTEGSASSKRTSTTAYILTYKQKQI